MVDWSFRTIGNATVAGVSLIAVVIIIVIAVPGAVGAEASYVVLSDSMEPAFSSGDIVIVQSVAPAAISTGDVITYQSPRAEGNAQRVSHRVIGIDQTQGEYVFQTKGDANEQPDAYQVSEADLTGKVWFVIPYVGYLVQFAGTTLGMFLLIVVPGILLVVTELWSVYQDATTNTEG